VWWRELLRQYLAMLDDEHDAGLIRQQLDDAGQPVVTHLVTNIRKRPSE
jgi:hypothetical protein